MAGGSAAETCVVSGLRMVDDAWMQGSCNPFCRNKQWVKVRVFVAFLWGGAPAALQLLLT